MSFAAFFHGSRVRLYCAFSLVSFAICPAASTVCAQQVNHRVRTAQAAVNNAQIKFNSAQQALGKAHEDLMKAQSTQQIAFTRLYQARQDATNRYATEFGITAELGQREAARHRIDARRNALEAELKTHSDYQAAEKETEAARHRLEELPEDKSLTDEQRQQIGSDLAAAIRRPTEMRKEAIAKDFEVQRETKHWQASAKKIAEVQPRLKKAIESDTAVMEAEREERRTATALEKAQAALSRTEQTLNAAQANLAAQNQQLETALAQSRHMRHRY